MTHLNPFTLINANADSDWLLVCEHASNAVPEELQQLGLSGNALKQHIAYDIGAADVTRYLAEKLNATAIICNYSRLVIDCNRPLSHADCIPLVSDGVVIPANQYLTAEQRAWRIEQIYQPFHRAVFETLCKKLAHNPHTRFVNIHSLTPQMSATGERRPWDVSFVHRDEQLPLEMLQYFRQQTDYCIGDNEPYNGYIHKGYTVPAHADAQEIPALLVEFRQDLIDTKAGVSHWAELLLSAMEELD